MLLRGCAIQGQLGLVPASGTDPVLASAQFSSPWSGLCTIPGLSPESSRPGVPKPSEGQVRKDIRDEATMPWETAAQAGALERSHRRV